MTKVMTDREVTYETGFYDDLCWWRDEDPDTGRRVVELVELVIQRPGEGRGRPKRLGSLPGIWSRRITRTHRLYYEVRDQDIHFISCRGHDMPQRFYDEIRGGRR